MIGKRGFVIVPSDIIDGDHIVLSAKVMDSEIVGCTRNVIVPLTGFRSQRLTLFIIDMAAS